jgi:hypothetical protein
MPPSEFASTLGGVLHKPAIDYSIDENCPVDKCRSRQGNKYTGKQVDKEAGSGGTGEMG